MFTTLYRLFFCILLATQSARAEQALQGHDHPVLAINMSVATDWNTAMQFLDLMRTARPWLGHKTGQWGGMKFEELDDGGYLDDAGWPRQIPDNIERIGTVFGWAGHAQGMAYREGRYVLRYDGTGVIRMGGGVRTVQTNPGEVIFDIVQADQNWFFDIMRTDPADHIRNISIVPERYVALYDAGAVFNPDWLDLVKDMREIRFMNWALTNNSNEVRWADRPKTDVVYVGKGQPVEYMVQLANEIGADAWFTMPHQADADYIRNYAIYVRDHLDPRLKVRVEWSNETWNWIFQQTHWTRDQSVADWGQEAPRDYAVKMATQTAQIWREVFQGVHANRLENVLGGFPVNTWDTMNLFKADVWKKHEPDAWVAPADTFDAFAITSYFSGSMGSNAGQRADLLREMNRNNADINKYIYDQIRETERGESIPIKLNGMREQAELANEQNLTLILYEGGQHVHSELRATLPDQAAPTSEEDLNRLNEVLGAFVRSPEMAALYQELWDGWAEFGQGPFMQYSDVTPASRFGSFGLYAHLLDETPRSRLLQTLNQTQAPWWPSEGGPHYQQGIMQHGTDGADRMVGTAEEDYLMGMGGDDVFVVTTSRDGLNGGPGRDEAVFPHAASAYTWVSENKGIRVFGPDSETYLANIEVLSFADGKQVSVGE